MLMRKSRVKNQSSSHHSRVENITHKSNLEKHYLQSTVSKLFRQQRQVTSIEPEVFADSLYSHLEWLINNRIKDIQTFQLPEQPLKTYEEFVHLERVFIDLIDTYQYLEQHLLGLEPQQDILNLKDNLPQLKNTLNQIEVLLELSINWQQIQSLLDEHAKQVDRAGRNLATTFALEHVVIEELDQQLEHISHSALAISECINLLSEKEVDTNALSAQYFDLMNYLMYLQEQLNEQYEMTIPESIF